MCLYYLVCYIALGVTDGKIFYIMCPSDRRPSAKNADNERDVVNGAGGKGISSFPTDAIH